MARMITVLLDPFTAGFRRCRRGLEVIVGITLIVTGQYLLNEYSYLIPY